MTTNGADIPKHETPENTEKQQKSKELRMREILNEGMRSFLLTNNHGIDPVQFDRIKNQKSKILNGAKEMMQGILISKGKEFGDISQDDLGTGISDKLILQEFIAHTHELRAIRDKIQSRVRHDFPNIDRNIPNFSTTIEKKIGKIRSDELSEALQNINRLKKFIASLYGVDSNDIEIKEINLPDVFHDIPTDSDLYRRLSYEYAHQKNGGSPVSIVLLKEIFSYYEDKPLRKVEIAQFFDIELTLREFEDLGIWNQNEFLEFAQKHFSDVWNDLDEHERKQIVAAMKHDDIFKVRIADIDSAKFTDRIYNYLDRGFGDKLQYLSLERASADMVMGAIIPEKNTDPNDNTLRLHNPVMDHVVALRSKSGAKPIEGFDKIREVGSVLLFKDPKDPSKTIMMEILDINVDLSAGDHGIKYRILSLKDGRLSRSATPESLTYSDFGHLLWGLGDSSRVLSSTEFQERITEDSNLKDYDNGNLIDHPEIKFLDATQENIEGSVDWLKKELDQIDPEGTSFGYDNGVNFLSQATSIDKKGQKKSFDSSFSILSITDTGIVISNGEEKQPFGLVEFLAAVKELGFKRNAKISSDEDVVKVFQSFGVDGDARLKDGQLVIKKKDIDHHDEHAHDEHADVQHGHGDQDSDTVAYEFFKSEVDGSHIRIVSIDKNFVSFGEYDSGTSVEDIQKRNSTKSLTEKEKNGLYSYQRVPIGYFLKYLATNKLKATTDNLLQEDAYHEEKPHMHGSFMKSWTNSWSIHDMIQGIHGIMHGVEHYLEKGSKLNASRAALRMGRLVGLPADVIAQLQADEVGNIRDIVDKIKTKLKDQNGPVARLKVMHIIHNSSSRPEEVAAATMYMVESYGHLYAEDIKTGQGGEHFINALIYACGFKSDAQRIEQKEKARKKFKADIGTEPGQQITEEEMIWGFMKTIDGNAESNPMAGTLIKAMGGPSGWEKAFRKEGFEGAREKGVRQTSDLANAQGRINKFKSALATSEINTAFGMMGTIPGKNPAPDMQSAPIMWALFGITGYSSSPLPQQIFQFAASKGHSFHAYSFLRNKEVNDLYKDTFIHAMDGIASHQDIDRIQKAIHTMHFHGHFVEGKEEDAIGKARLKAINTVEEIWKKYQDKGLHARLQGMDQKWFLDQMHKKKNGQVQKYFSQLSSTLKESTMGTGEIQGEDANSWNKQMGYVGSPILKVTSDGFSSITYMLNKLKVNGSTNYSLNNDYEDRFWKPALAIVKNLQQDTSIPPELKRKQFDQYRRDIIEQMREFFNARTRASSGQKDVDDAVDKIRSNQYGRDIESLGIDLTQIFKTEYSPSSDSDYQSFLSGGNTLRTTRSYSEKIKVDHSQSIADIVQTKKTAAANDSSFRQAA